MPHIDIVDSSWVGADRRLVAAAVADPARWARWWPELRLAVSEARGVQGLRWTVSTAGWAGSMEIYLEPGPGGTVLHYLLRLDAELTADQIRRLVGTYRHRAKQLAWELADELDPGRWQRLRSSDGSRPPGSL